MRILNFIGDGPVTWFSALKIYMDLRNNNAPVVFRFYTAGSPTGGRGAPSISTPEGNQVVPPPISFMQQIRIPYQQGGLLVNEAANLSASDFIEEMASYVRNGDDGSSHDKIMTELGQYSMKQLELLASAPELKDLFASLEFTPEAKPGEHEKQRFDIWFDAPNAEQTAEKNVAFWRSKGYQSAIVSPDEMVNIDLKYAGFIERYSHFESDGKRVWNVGACAIIRPGGCINAQQFLQEIKRFLKSALGTYTDEQGKTQPCLQIIKSYVEGVTIHGNNISGLRIKLTNGKRELIQAQPGEQHFYCFAPGDRIREFTQLGFKCPPTATINGTFLNIAIPMPEADTLLKIDGFRTNNTTSVCQSSTAESEQGKVLVLHVSGLKGLNANDEPFTCDGAFTQIQMLCKVYPTYMARILTQEQLELVLTSTKPNHALLDSLGSRGIIFYAQGARAVRSNGLPMIGHLQTQQGLTLANAVGALCLGSAGWSYGAGTAALLSRLLGQRMWPQQIHSMFCQTNRLSPQPDEGYFLKKFAIDDAEHAHSETTPALSKI
jgi:hypothetical protein